MIASSLNDSKFFESGKKAKDTVVCRVFQINQESVSWEGTRLSAPWQVDLPRIAFSAVTYYIIARSAHACDWFLPSLSKIFHSNRKIPFSLCIQNLRMMRIYKGSLIELSLRDRALASASFVVEDQDPSYLLKTCLFRDSFLSMDILAWNWFYLESASLFSDSFPLTTENTTSNSHFYFLDVSNKWFYTFILPVFPR